LTCACVRCSLSRYALGDRADGADPEALVRLLGEAKGAAVARAVAKISSVASSGNFATDESAAARVGAGGGGAAAAAAPSRVEYAAATAATDSVTGQGIDDAGACSITGDAAYACTCVLTGDQVVVRDGKILEKPTDEDEALAFISAYSGGECSTVGSCTATGECSLR
jgi:hypothetical protein